jgi:hypothetical protein
VKDSYKQSTEQMEKFKETLRKFLVTLNTRKMFKKLNVEIKEPKVYDIDYVLSIAKLIEERREEAENTRVCKRFIRKCLRGVVKHKDVLTGIINMAPSDVYGSVISGGFTVILAVSPMSFAFLNDLLTFLPSEKGGGRTREPSQAHPGSPCIYTAKTKQCATVI